LILLVGRQGFEPWTHGLRVLLIPYLPSFTKIHKPLFDYINQPVIVIPSVTKIPYLIPTR